MSESTFDRMLSLSLSPNVSNYHIITVTKLHLAIQGCSWWTNLGMECDHLLQAAVHLWCTDYHILASLKLGDHVVLTMTHRSIIMEEHDTYYIIVK